MTLWGAGSLDYLVGALFEQRRHLEVERLRGFQVDDQLELDRKLDGEIAGLLALEDTIGDRRFEVDEAGDVAARARQARDEALPDRIDEVPEHDRDGGGLLLENPRRRRARGKNEIGLGRNDLLCEVLKRIHIRSTPAVVDTKVTASTQPSFW